KTDTIVGIMVERSLEMMVGIMGILKAGGAYLPISPEYPDDRITYMLEDSKTTILLTQKHLLDTVKLDGIIIDLEDKQLYQEDKDNLEIVNIPNNLAYIIYTSGSTGKPKGVMIQHGNVINLVTGLGKIIYDRYAAPLNVALIAPYVFDASVKQIFASLLRGNCLYIVPEEYRNIGEKLVEYYIENSIDISDGTPSHFKLILGDNREKIKGIPVKHFIIGGEALPVDVVQDFLAFFKDKKPNITNIYGPTECCVDSTAFLVDSDQLNTLSAIPIGRPLVNYSVYVLDKDNKLQPVGVAGELCIAGDGLARGYLNKPEMTEEKFVANPFDPGKKMYKTGDLVRWLTDGNVEFLGRIDHQVKIRGYRIEIGEIESVIKSHPLVQDSIVIVHTDNTGEKGLVAYIVPKTNSDEKYSEASLKEYLKKKLPKYMIPAMFIQLENIPLNINGKVDRFALPKPDIQQRGSDESFIEPRNKEEIEMAKIWAKTLGTPKIGIDDDFFDLGGDSFKAIKLVRSISRTLGVMELFKNSTIRELVAYLSKDTLNKRTMLNEFTKPIDEKDKVASIICFPFGGGSAISYQALANTLPKNYSLYSVELPGHDYSCPDEELASIEDSAVRCLEEIKEKVKGSIVLYGHCLGATMAALLAYKLEEAGFQVDGVFMGAMFPSPRISNTFFNIWDKIFPSRLTDRGNRDMLKTLGGLNSDIASDETEFILRNLKHDSNECINWYTQLYNNKEHTKFKAPITCVIGEGDRATEFYQERYKEWEYFSDNVDLKTIKDAGHFFFKNQAVELTEIIKEKIDLWQGRSLAVTETKKTDESKENTVKLKTPDKKQVVPSMRLFLMVAIVQIISEIGTILSTFGSGIWIFQQTNALSQFAMMLLFAIVPTILILPISGAIVDRFDRRLIIIAADILSAICSLYLLVLLYNNGLQIWQVYLFTVIASVATCFRQPAYLAAITQITPKMYLAQANSVSQFSTAIGGILASICGGLFMHSIGFKGLIVIDFVTFVISIVALIFIRFPDTMFTRLEESIQKELMGGWNFITKRKSLVAMVIFFLITNFLVSIFDVTMTPLILTFTNPSVLGVINAFFGTGVLIGAILMLITGGTKKRAKGMVGFVIPLAISMIIAGMRPLPVFAAIALFGVALSTTIVNVHWQSLIQVKVGLELQGRVFAVNRMLVATLTPISYITAGVLADKVFAPMMQNNFFNSPVVNLVLGAGTGREMRLNLLIAGAILFVWGIIGLRYKPLSEMDDTLEDASPGEVIIRDKDKLQQIYDGKINVGM
ncbi:MAG: amino acid adenylation domain-containing protein, partial [Lutisporaceae bacterium]